jgi:hypothetical protein
MATGIYKMRQCSMRRGNAVQRAWIPEKFAVEGKFLRLKDADTGAWEDGWKVISVSDAVLSSDIVAERSQDYKNTRRASDT